MGIEQLKYLLAIVVLALFFLLLIINRYGTYRKRKSGKEKDDDKHWL